jgi:HK97 family phage prohead protease
MPIVHVQRRPAPLASGLEIKVRTFELKMLGADGPDAPASFGGHGARFHNIDSAGDIIAPGAFADDLEEFLREGHVGGLNHNWDDPIARPVVAYEDEKGLYVESGPIVDTAHGTDVAKLLRKGIITKLSIGFRVVREQRVASMAALRDYWKSHQYTPTEEDVDRATHAIEVGHKEFGGDGDLRTVKGVRMLRRIKLYEVSPVTVPANMLAGITGVKSIPREPSATKGSWSDYSREVATAVGEFAERATRRVHNRLSQKAGRVLSQSNYDSIASVADAMESNAGQLRAVLAAAEARRNEPATDAAKAEDAASVEVTPPPSAAVEPATPAVPPVPDPVDAPPTAPADPPAFDPSDHLAAYIATRRAATLALAGSTIPCPTH